MKEPRFKFHVSRFKLQKSDGSHLKLTWEPIVRLLAADNALQACRGNTAQHET